MGCTLDRFTTYDIGRVVHDNADDGMSLQLTRPPETCPDRSFGTHKYELRVIAGQNPNLTYNAATGKPVITVPTKAYVEEINAGHGMIWWMGALGITLLGALMIYAGFRAVFCKDDDEEDAKDPSHPTPSPKGSPPSEDWVKRLGGRPRTHAERQKEQRVSVPYHPPQPAPVVVNQSSGSVDILTGMLVGNMLSQHDHRTTVVHEVIREREFVNECGEPIGEVKFVTGEHHVNDGHVFVAPSPVEESTSFESDDDSKRSSYSSDSSSSYSSDSSSSYSSDSSSSSDSSYSSDSGSSDSGSSFGGD